MGMPQVIIDFQEKANTIISRSSKGFVGLILKDDTKTFDIKTYNNFAEVDKLDWKNINFKMIEMAFIGMPKRVFVLRVSETGDATAADYGKLMRKRIDYLSYPEASSTEKTAIMSYFSNVKREKIKLIIPGTVIADNERIINNTMGYITKANELVTKEEFSARLAGILAGIPQTMSSTSYVIEEAASLIPEEIPSDYDVAIDGGKLVLVDDGDKIKIARGVNTLKTLTGNKGPSFKKIKIVEGMDIITTDIRDTFENSYSGKVLNDYFMKLQFLGAVGIYFKEIAKVGVLDSSYNNTAFIDKSEQENYIKTTGGKTQEELELMEEKDILKFNTGSYVFAGANVKFADTMEDLKLPISL